MKETELKKILEELGLEEPKTEETKYPKLENLSSKQATEIVDEMFEKIEKGDSSIELHKPKSQSDYTIFKYSLDISPKIQVLGIPYGARMLKADFQGGELCIWALVEKGQDIVPRGFHVCTTGGDVPDPKNLWHISTVQAGPMVYHIFEDNSLEF